MAEVKKEYFYVQGNEVKTEKGQEGIKGWLGRTWSVITSGFKKSYAIEKILVALEQKNTQFSEIDQNAIQYLQTKISSHAANKKLQRLNIQVSRLATKISSSIASRPGSIPSRDELRASHPGEIAASPSLSEDAAAKGPETAYIPQLPQFSSNVTGAQAKTEIEALMKAFKKEFESLEKDAEALQKKEILYTKLSTTMEILPKTPENIRLINTALSNLGDLSNQPLFEFAHCCLAWRFPQLAAPGPDDDSFGANVVSSLPWKIQLYKTPSIEKLQEFVSKFVLESHADSLETFKEDFTTEAEKKFYAEKKQEIEKFFLNQKVIIEEAKKKKEETARLTTTSEEEGFHESITSQIKTLKAPDQTGKSTIALVVDKAKTDPSIWTQPLGKRIIEIPLEERPLEFLADIPLQDPAPAAPAAASSAAGQAAQKIKEQHPSWDDKFIQLLCTPPEDLYENIIEQPPYKSVMDVVIYLLDTMGTGNDRSSLIPQELRTSKAYATTNARRHGRRAGGSQNPANQPIALPPASQEAPSAAQIDSIDIQSIFGEVRKDPLVSWEKFLGQTHSKEELQEKVEKLFPENRTYPKSTPAKPLLVEASEDEKEKVASVMLSHPEIQNTLLVLKIVKNQGPGLSPKQIFDQLTTGQKAFSPESLTSLGISTDLYADT